MMEEDKTKEEFNEEIKLLNNRIAELEELSRAFSQRDSMRLATVMRDANDSIIIQDIDGNITGWNRGAELMYGYTQKEALEMNIERLTIPDRLEEHKKITRSLITGEVVTSFETKRVTKSGRIIDVWLTVTKLEEIPIDSIISTGRDITKSVSFALIERNISERKQAETDLRTSKQIIEGIINSIPVRVFWKDKNLVYLGCNTIFAADAGFADPKDIVGKDDYQMGWKEQAESYRKDDLQVISSGLPKLLIEEPQSTPKGEAKTLLTNKLPLRDSHGEINGIIGTYMDITERKNLERMHRTLAAIVESADDAIISKDLMGSIISWNKGAETMYGYTSDETIGKNISLLMPPDRPDEFTEILSRVSRGDSIKHYETKRRRKDGKVIDISLAVSPIRDETGMIIGASSVAREITERKKAQEELQQAYKLLKETQDQLIQTSKMSALGQLAGGVAHELNNPLTGVLNYVQLIKMEAEAKKEFNLNDFKSLLGVIESSALRCKSITQSLLDFSHSSIGKLSSISLNEIADKTIDLVLHELKLQNISFKKELQPDLPLIMGDFQLLQQVAFGLINNAHWATLKKYQEGGVITVKTWHDPKERTASLAVFDTGIGISEENIKKIFTPFFTTKDIGEGTGLGLALFYNIVKSMNGNIRIESQVGVGSAFTITFPY